MKKNLQKEKLSFLIKILFFIFIFIGNPKYSIAQSHYYHYEDYHFKIRDIDYKRFILPQMRNIIVEIPYNVRELLNSNKNLIDFSSSFFLSKIKLEMIIRSKSKSTQKSFWNIVKKINLTCKSYRQFYFKTTNQSISFNLLRAFKKLNFDCLKFQNKIVQLKFLKKNYPNILKKEILPLALLSSTIFLSSRSTVQRSFAPKVQLDYDNFLTYFYFPLLRIYSQKKEGKILFKNKIDSFNSSLNIFLMEMEKKDKLYLPQNYIKKLKILINRWNSILKVILRKR